MQKGTDLLLFQLEQTGELRLLKVILLLDPFASEKTGMNMWRKNCPVCRQPLAKKHPAETVPCSCGKYVWKG